MGRVLRENTKKKTAISARKAQAVKNNKPTSRVTKQQLLENAIQQSLALSSIASTDPGTLNTNEQRWLTQNFSDTNSPFGYVPFRLAKLLSTRRAGAKNLYLWVQANETMFDGAASTFPILMVAQGNFPPTTRVAFTAIQKSQEIFFTFEQAGIAWEPLQLPDLPVENNNKIFVLKTVNAQLLRQLLLQLEKPLDSGLVMPILTSNDVASEEPNVAGTIKVKYNNVDILWDPQDDNEFREVFEDYKADTDEEPSEAVKTEIQRLLLEEKQSLEAIFQEKVARNQQDFDDMVDRLATQHQTAREDILNHLDRQMRLYKLYPADLPEPHPTEFGDTGGVRKTNLINRFCSATQYFES